MKMSELEGLDTDKMCCPFCKIVGDEIWSLSPDNDQDFEYLEKRLGVDPSNWKICFGCTRKYRVQQIGVPGVYALEKWNF